MPELPRKYYNVTCDVAVLVKRWCESQKPQLKCPDVEYFKDEISAPLKTKLIKVFEREALKYKYYPGLDGERAAGKGGGTNVSFISYEEVRRTISKTSCPVVSQIGGDLPWITLDRAYCVKGVDADHCLDVTRLYDLDGCVKVGLGIRPESSTLGHMGPALDSAVETCVKGFEPGQSVVLVDDGLYSGSTMAEVVRLLKGHDVRVEFIVTALTRTEGIESLSKKIDELWGSDTKSMRPQIYPGLISPRDGVRDWVCERDFFFGVPLSGRTAGKLEGTTPIAHTEPKDGKELIIGIPYSCLSTNDLQSCAALQSGAYTMAEIGLRLSLKLWDKIQTDNDRKILIKELPRIPFPLNKRLDAPIVDELQMMLKSVSQFECVLES